MSCYSMTEARWRLSELLNRALAGEEVIVARRGAPVARLVPVVGGPLDLEWLRAHCITPKAGSDFDTAALIRQMRDEGY